MRGRLKIVEMIEIDRLAFDQGRRRNQLIRGAGIELEPALQQAVQLALFDRRRLAVERDDVNQQRVRRQPIAGIVKRPALVRVGETTSAMNCRNVSSISSTELFEGHPGYMVETEARANPD